MVRGDEHGAGLPSALTVSTMRQTGDKEVTDPGAPGK